jgi:hypothetical protein
LSKWYCHDDAMSKSNWIENAPLIRRNTKHTLKRSDSF